MNSTEKDDIATIMRQTECYDVEIIKEKYSLNNHNVLETIFDIMNMKTIEKKPSNKFEEMRIIMDQKEKLFFNAMQKRNDTK